MNGMAQENGESTVTMALSSTEPSTPWRSAFPMLAGGQKLQVSRTHESLLRKARLMEPSIHDGKRASSPQHGRPLALADLSFAALVVQAPESLPCCWSIRAV
jgi:hypothetical protein